MNLWCPWAVRDPLNDVSAGPHTLGHAYKGVLHTTEGTTYGGARAAYSAFRSWPHFTVSYETRTFEVWQHTALNRAARALRNLAGGHQTNLDGVIQVEIVATCDVRNRGKHGWLYVEDLPLAYLHGIARLMRWIEDQTGIQRRAAFQWKSYPSSYGGANGVRMSYLQWHEFRGWCGHQHVPENLHGDPGLIDIDLLLTMGAPPAPTPMPSDEEEPMFVALAPDGVGQFLVFSSGRMVHIVDGQTAQRLHARFGMPIPFDPATWNNLNQSA